MDGKAFKDPEKQNFGRIFVILGVGLLLALGWELYEEAYGRQPWISFQDEFKSLELAALNKDLQNAQQDFDAKQKRLENSPVFAEPTSQANYRKHLAQVEALLNSPAYRESLSKLEQLKAQLTELGVQHRFLKADLDAAYYGRDLSIESSGKANEPLTDTAEVARVKEQIKKNEDDAVAVQDKLNAANAALAITEKTLDTIKAQMDKEGLAVAIMKERVAKVEARPPAIQQVVVNGLGEYQRVDRCTTCHAGIDRPEFASAEKLVFRTHPDYEELFKHHPIDKNGCTSCHDGQGRALNVKEAHEGDEHWHATLLGKNYVNSTCVKCHANAPLLPEAANVAQGATIFQDRGCVGCHKVDGSPYLTATIGKLGPDLSKIKGKVRPDWLVTWITDPKKVHPRTLMPEFGVKDRGLEADDAIKIASYLSAASGDLAKSPGSSKYVSEHHATAEDVACGKHIFETRGCLGCHEVGNYRVAGSRHVSLDGIGSKVSPQWIYSWIEDPSAMSKTTIMPRFDLKPEELACLTDYLSSLKEPETKVTWAKVTAEDLHPDSNMDAGKKLVKKYGCYSCHNIPGFENNVERIGPELSDFAAKDPSLLFWGTKNVVPPSQRNWYTWTRARLNEPKVFETDRIAAVMPNFHLSDDETDKVMSFIKTLSSQQTVAKEHRRALRPGEAEQMVGWQLINEYGCIGCHSLYDPKLTQQVAGFRKEPVAHYGTLAPNLSVEGDRVRPDWLADFLRAPYKMRPYLASRMPTFTFQNKDHQALVGYFKAGAKGQPFIGRKDTPDLLPVANAERGKHLISQYQCVTCHQVGGKELPAGSTVSWYHDMNTARKFAPDLSNASAKLNPDWADRWIENPHRILPDTTMPYVQLTREEASAIRSFLVSAAMPASTSKAPTPTKAR